MYAITVRVCLDKVCDDKLLILINDLCYIKTESVTVYTCR